MIVAIKFLKVFFAASFLCALVTLRVVVAYSAWSISLSDQVASRFHHYSQVFRGTRKVYRPYL